MRRRFASLALFAVCTACAAAVKPLAVWNGEFTSGSSSSTRNGVTLNRGSALFKGQYFKVQKGGRSTSK